MCYISIHVQVGYLNATDFFRFLNNYFYFIKHDTSIDPGFLSNFSSPIWLRFLVESVTIVTNIINIIFIVVIFFITTSETFFIVAKKNFFIFMESRMFMVTGYIFKNLGIMYSIQGFGPPVVIDFLLEILSKLSAVFASITRHCYIMFFKNWFKLGQ